MFGYFTDCFIQHESFCSGWFQILFKCILQFFILFNTSDTFRLNEILCELKLLCVSVLHVLTAHACLKVVSVFQAEGEDSLKKMQLMELAILNGTYRDASIKTCKRQTGQSYTVILNMKHLCQMYWLKWKTWSMQCFRCHSHRLIQIFILSFYSKHTKTPPLFINPPLSCYPYPASLAFSFAASSVSQQASRVLSGPAPVLAPPTALRTPAPTGPTLMPLIRQIQTVLPNGTPALMAGVGPESGLIYTTPYDYPYTLAAPASILEYPLDSGGMLGKPAPPCSCECSPTPHHHTHGQWSPAPTLVLRHASWETKQTNDQTNTHTALCLLLDRWGHHCSIIICRLIGWKCLNWLLALMSCDHSFLHWKHACELKTRLHLQTLSGRCKHADFWRGSKSWFKWFENL